MAHIIVFLYDEDGNVIGEYHPPDDPETGGGGAAAQTWAAVNQNAFGAAITAAIGNHMDKALDGITVSFKVKA